jgi:hypothetical protein
MDFGTTQNTISFDVERNLKMALAGGRVISERRGRVRKSGSDRVLNPAVGLRLRDLCRTLRAGPDGDLGPPLRREWHDLGAPGRGEGGVPCGSARVVHGSYLFTLR